MYITHKLKWVGEDPGSIYGYRQYMFELFFYESIKSESILEHYDYHASFYICVRFISTFSTPRFEFLYITIADKMGLFHASCKL